MKSLSKDTIKKYTVEFRRDIFNFLFNSKGTSCSSSRPGKKYNLVDFNSDYFMCDSFVYYKHHSEGVHMYSFIKFSPVSYCLSSDSVWSSYPCDFCELLHVEIVKECC